MNLGSPENNYEKFYKLKLGDVYLECGALWGRYGKIASEKVGTNGKIILVEPNPINIIIMKEYLRNLNNITIVEAAISDVVGEDKISIDLTSSPEHWTGLSLNHQEQEKFMSVPFKVSTNTIDNIVKSHELTSIDLLAWDIEGLGIKALQGAKNSLSEHIIKNLALDCHGGEESGFLVKKILCEYNYQMIEVNENFVYAHLV